MATFESSQRLSDFGYQIKNWAYPQAKKAHDANFFIETIGISVNAINAILRELILKKVIEDEPFDDGEGNIVGIESYDEHPYLVSLLTDYENPLMGGLNDRAFYTESQRLKIIDQELLEKLIQLYRRRNAIFHRLFGNVILHKTGIEPTADGELVFGEIRALHQTELKGLSAEYLELFELFIKMMTR